MGDKKSSKQVGTKAKINIIPGFDILVRDEDHCVELANKVTYPVMVKAVGGGGGKGMRIAWNDAECREGYWLAKNGVCLPFFA
jgi:propionyl-CoA carboxylase alpha chain